MDPVEVVRRLGGTATYAQTVGITTRSALRDAVARGRLRRLGRGVYGLPELPAPRAAAAATHGVVSHLSAAVVHGLDVATAPDEVHVTVRPGARPARVEGVRLHWSTLEPTDVEGRVTSVLRTVLDCAASLPFADALAVADSALRERLLTKSELVVAAHAQAARRQGRCTRVAHAADAGAENVFESCTRAVLVERGIRGLQTQVPVLLASFTAHVDLGDPLHRLAVEAEGFEYHRDRAAFARDCERYSEMAAADWRVLRFTWHQVRFRPDWVADVVLRAQKVRAPDVRRWSVTSRWRDGEPQGNDDAVARTAYRRTPDSLER